MPLYICPTPIGNLEDVTLRVLETLKNSDEIYCEDTRTSKVFLSKYQIDTPTRYYDDHHGEKHLEEIIDKLKKNLKISLISDAGMPLISDPGFGLVRRVREENLEMTVLPGASACITALVGSSLSTDTFTFLGFMPRKENQRQELLEKFSSIETTLIFYETANRLIESLKTIQSILPDRRVVVARELTKMFEEYIEIDFNKLDDITLKGEMVVIIDKGDSTQEDLNSVKEEMQSLVDYNMSKKDAINYLKNKYKISKNKLYEMSLEITQ